MGNSTSKKNEAHEADETVHEADICCQSYSRLQEADRMELQSKKSESKTGIDRRKSDDMMLTKQTSKSCCSDDKKRKPGKESEKKKKEKSKKEKKKLEKSIPIDKAVDSENENKTALMEKVNEKLSVEVKVNDDENSQVSNSTKSVSVFETNSGTREDPIEKPNLISEDIHSSKEQDIAKHIIENVENELYDEVVMQEANIEIKCINEMTNDSNRTKCVGEKEVDILMKQEICENLSNTKKAKTKSSKSKKVSKQLEDNNVDAVDKDNTSKESSKKKKSKKEKVDKSVAFKQSKKEKTIKSKGAKKEKQIESHEHMNDKGAKSTKHEKEKAAKSKESKKNTNKKGNTKETYTETVMLSEEIPMTSSEEDPSTEEKDEEIQTELNHDTPEFKVNTGILVMKTISGHTTVPFHGINDVEKKSKHEESDSEIRSGGSKDEPPSSPVLAKNEIDKETEQFTTDTSVSMEDDVQEHNSDGIFHEVSYEMVTVQTPITDKCREKTEKTKSIKARKDSANQKKKVKSQRKTQKENGESSNICSECLTDIEEADRCDKKLSKKESKKKHDDTIVSKKLSKKEKKTNKKAKNPKDENVRLLESESSFECRSKNSVSSLERIRPSLIFDDFVPPEQLDIEGISLSSVSLDGTDDVFPVPRSTHLDVNGKDLGTGACDKEKQLQEIPTVTGPDISVIDVSIVRL